MDLEGNSNSETSACFLRQLGERHHGPLQVIWDNAPAHRGEAVREYLQTPGLGLRLVNPRLHEGRLCRATARTSTRMKPLGMGTGRGNGKPVPGNQGGGAGAGRQLPGWAGQTERGSPAALPNSPAIKSRSTPARLPAPGKCTSHLGFSLGTGRYTCGRTQMQPAWLQLGLNVIRHVGGATRCGYLLDDPLLGDLT